jgi:peptidoglycan hydrolase-like protein with peptidoglycan-binding domain
MPQDYLFPNTDYGLPEWATIASPGDSGNIVEVIQAMLVGLGYKADRDGFYGDNTIDGVRAFRECEGLPDHDYVDYDTISLLYERYAEAQGQPQPPVEPPPSPVEPPKRSISPWLIVGLIVLFGGATTG